MSPLVTIVALLSTTRWSHSKTCHAPSTVWKIFVQDFWCDEELSATKVLRVLEGQEEVHVSDQDPQQHVKPTSSDDHVETKQHPWQVHGLESCAEPEADNLIFVELTPDIENTENHRIHQQRKRSNESNNNKTNPIKQQHEDHVSRTAVKVT